MATQHDDVEVEGVIADGGAARSSKAVKFQGDYWDDFEWVPLSQCEVVMQPDSDTPGRCVLYIRRWLAKKNGWVEE